MHSRYEDWLDREWGIPRYGSSQQRQPVMRVAEAKRERKAAKRRRDAELTRLGQEDGLKIVALLSTRRPTHAVRELIMTGLSGLTPGAWADYVEGAHVHRWLLREGRRDRSASARRTRRGEVTP